MKSKRRKPDLTLDVGERLTVFTDKPRSKLRASGKVMTSYDPALATLFQSAKNGDAKHSQPAITELASILDDCLRTAGAIKTKRAIQLVKLLKDARRQVDLIRS